MVFGFWLTLLGSWVGDLPPRAENGVGGGSKIGFCNIHIQIFEVFLGSFLRKRRSFTSSSSSRHIWKAKATQRIMEQMLLPQTMWSRICCNCMFMKKKEKNLWTFLAYLLRICFKRYIKFWIHPFSTFFVWKGLFQYFTAKNSGTFYLYW